MTMDINNRKAEIKAEVYLTKSEELTEMPVKTQKRSFDVAFLMLPDDKMKQKQNKFSKYAYEIELNRTQPANRVIEPTQSDDEDEEIEVDAPKMDFSKKYYTQKQQIFGDPHLSKPKNVYEHDFRNNKSLNTGNPETKSAFSKVSTKETRQMSDSRVPENHLQNDNRISETRMSPNLSISPDLSYQNSLSPSPPIINRNYQSFQTQMLSPNHLFKAQTMPYQNNFMHESFATQHVLDNPYLSKPANELLKLRPAMLAQYRPELQYNYSHQFQQQEMLKMQQNSQEMRNPAAAILSSLLPPSLAALSLPAQNVCAKCNISFRMTSDLVYHMRSHHKNETPDFCKRKREDKLKCPVCAESFRERHHLTRHMTAHQDKDNDGDEPEAKKKSFVAFTK